ncbi:hypothetical protein EON67_03660 [archaeon]|nr:MAG: hypothetical protein EON67_03660 [archaeon]
MCVCARECVCTPLLYLRCVVTTRADTFSARDITGVALPGIDHVVYVTLIDGVVYFRVYNITLEQADGAIPRTVLSPMGPFLDLVIRRTHFAAADLEKQAHKVPVEYVAPCAYYRTCAPVCVRL